MRRLFVLTILAGLLLNANAFAAGAKKEPSSEEQAKQAEGRGEVCYREALTPGHVTLNMPPPCAPKNYIFMGLPTLAQDRVIHDQSGIWSDEEIGSETETWFWEKHIKIDGKEITMSIPVGSICFANRTCPIRIRIKEQEKPIIIKDVDGLGSSQPCGTLEYLFLRDDLMEFLACGEKFPLKIRD